MRTLSLAAAIVFMMSVAMAWSQPYGVGKGERGPKIEEWKEKLDLNDAQVEQWKEVHEKFKPKFDELKDDVDLSRRDKMKAMLELADERDEEIKEILTDDQWDKFVELRDERRENNRKGRRGGNGKQ